MMSWDLDVIQAFLNSLDREQGVEALTRPGELADWLRRRDLLKRGVKLSRADLKRARELREALRDLLEANSGRPVPSAVHATLDREASKARLGRPFGRESVAASFEESTGRLLIEVLRAQADGSWSRLKTCTNGACRWVFRDRSRNRSGQWCSMSLCGSRNKMRAYRRRLAEAV